MTAGRSALFGDLATLSFYPAHHITTGEGGAVFTNDEFLRRLAESFRDWGRDCFCAPGMDNTCGKRFGWKMGELPRGYDHKYTYGHLGYNLKMTDMQASVGVTQLDHLGRVHRRARKRNFAALKAGPDRSAGLPGAARGDAEQRPGLVRLSDHRQAGRALHAQRAHPPAWKTPASARACCSAVIWSANPTWPAEISASPAR
jgi:hypothetical protein